MTMNVCMRKIDKKRFRQPGENFRFRVRLGDVRVIDTKLIR